MLVHQRRERKTHQLIDPIVLHGLLLDVTHRSEETLDEWRALSCGMPWHNPQSSAYNTARYQVVRAAGKMHAHLYRVIVCMS